MTHTDVDRGKDREKETKKLLLLLSLLWLRPSIPRAHPLENPEKIYRRFISVPLVYAFDQGMGGERLRGAGRLGLQSS